jgi:hypothetical protein
MEHVYPCHLCRPMWMGKQVIQSKGRIVIRWCLRMRKTFRPERDKERVNRQEGWRNELVDICMDLRSFTIVRVNYLNWGKWIDLEILYFWRKSEKLTDCFLGKSQIKCLFWRHTCWRIYNLYIPAGEVLRNLIDRFCYFRVASLFTHNSGFIVQLTISCLRNTLYSDLMSVLRKTECLMKDKILVLNFKMRWVPLLVTKSDFNLEGMRKDKGKTRGTHSAHVS